MKNLRRIFPNLPPFAIGSLLIVLLSFVSFILPAQAADQHHRGKSILVLHSYHPGFPWTDGIMDGIQAVLEASGQEFDLHVEYLDANRYRDSEYFTHILDAILHYKLSAHSFGVVIVSDNEAFDFVLGHRQEFLAELPVVFCGINGLNPELTEELTKIAGVAEIPAYRETLQLVQRLHPRVERLVVVGGVGTFSDRINRKQLLEASLEPQFLQKFQVEFWDDVPMEELTERVKALPQEAIVLLNATVLDDREDELTLVRSAQRLRDVATVPIYSFWEDAIDHGIVGGKLLNARRQGEEAARLALRIFDGEDPDALPVVAGGTSSYLFDFLELERFRIPQRLLPAGSVVINRPPPFYELSKEQLWGALGGLCLLVVALLVNIARRYRAERALRESEARVRLLLLSTAEAIYGLDRGGLCTFCNPAGLQMLGFDGEEEVLGRSMHDLVHHTRSDGTPFPAEDCPTCNAWRHGDRVHLGDEVFWRRDGVGVPVEVWAYPVREQDRHLGAVVTFLDVTERRRAEEAMQRSLRELDAFVSTVSHDLRHPLTPIIGYAELLEQQYRSCLDGEGLAMIEAIRKSAEKMLSQMEDLLVLSRLGRLVAPSEAVDCDRLMEEVIGELAKLVASSGLRLEVAPLPRLRIPETLLSQALKNLVGNALRYAGADGGPIEVGAERRGDKVLFHVRDHGPGIAPEERERIFDAFYRGRTGQGMAGTGIGLSIVAKIARLCGGRVWVEETPGGGSTFRLELSEGGSRPLD